MALFLPVLRRLSFNVWVGAIATGLCFAFVAIGIYLTFRVLDFPDLTIDGSFPLGAAISAAMISAGFSAYLSLPIAVLGGALAGIATALIATRLRLHSLLASILTTTALISINLHIMGKSNIPLLHEATVFTPFSDAFNAWVYTWGGENFARLSGSLWVILTVGVLVVLAKFVFDWFMGTEIGLAMQATGENPQMARSLGRSTDGMIFLGLAASNGLTALSGAIFAQYQGFADVNMGLGLIIAGLAAVILGETIFQPRWITQATGAVILGMILYRIVIAAALNISFPLPGGGSFRIDAIDIKLATSVLVLGALWVIRIRKKKQAQYAES
jgi:putative ABC transport system permease protein